MALVRPKAAQGESAPTLKLFTTEVCFSHPRSIRDTGLIVFTHPSKWYNLYDGTFVKEINKVAEMCRQDD